MDVWWGSLLPQPPDSKEDPALERIGQLEKHLQEASSTIQELRQELKSKTKELEDVQTTVKQLRDLLPVTATPGATAQEEKGTKNSKNNGKAKSKETSGTDKVVWSSKDDIGIMIINDPPTQNLLSQELVQGLLNALDRLEGRGVRVVVLRAAPGVQVWSAGHRTEESVDYKEAAGRNPFPYDGCFQQLLTRVRAFPVPIIGALQGSIWGGACDLAACCDMLIGTPSVSFTITCDQVGSTGYSTTCGGSHFLGLLPHHVVKQLFFTTSPVTAEEAKNYGLLSKLVPADLLDKEVLKMATDVAARAQMVVKVKQLTNWPPR